MADETLIVARAGEWAGRALLGPDIGAAVAAAAPASVRVAVPAVLEQVLGWPLELAHVDGKPLAARGDITGGWRPGRTRPWSCAWSSTVRRGSGWRRSPTKAPGGMCSSCGGMAGAAAGGPGQSSTAGNRRGRVGAVAFWQAPTRDDEWPGALASLAAALEMQLGQYGFTMASHIGTTAALEAFLPRLRQMLADNAVLLVLDNRPRRRVPPDPDQPYRADWTCFRDLDAPGTRVVAG